MCALFAAVAAFTTPPPERATTAVHGIRGALMQKARWFPFKAFGKESRPRQVLESFRTGGKLSVLDETTEEKAAREAAWLAASEVEAAEAAAEDEKRARRAQLKRMREAKDGEQAAREAAWRTASVANLEQLQLEKGATPMANNDEEAGLRAEIDRILEREAALRSESERFSFEEEKAAELALENLERERLAEEKAAQLKAEQEALVAAEEAKREAALTARRYQGRPLVDEPAAEKAAREAAWLAA